MKFYVYYCAPEGYGGFLYGGPRDVGGWGAVLRLSEATPFATKKLAQAAVTDCMDQMRRAASCYTVMRLA